MMMMTNNADTIKKIHSWNMYTAKEKRMHGVTRSPLLLRCIKSYEYLFKYFSGGVAIAALA